MKVIRAEALGFCMGVKRAFNLACAEVKSNDSEKQVFTFGPLVHNPAVLSDLKKRGIEILTESFLSPIDSVNEFLNKLKDNVLIIRAHGIPPKIENNLRGKGWRVVDATCPKVKQSQLKVKSLVQDGYSVFLAGDSLHSEIEGILGYAPNCIVIDNTTEAGIKAKTLYEKNKKAKTALIGQTTISEEEYISIGKTIKEYFPDIKIIQSICSATKDRQHALRNLLLQADAVLIAGGIESANTQRLFTIAKESAKPCALVESADEIPDSFYNYETVGLCAGASTPDSIIDDIEKVLVKGR